MSIDAPDFGQEGYTPHESSAGDNILADPADNGLKDWSGTEGFSITENSGPIIFKDPIQEQNWRDNIDRKSVV